MQITPYHLTAAAAVGSTPLVVDSPHSWLEWPASTPTIAPASALRRTCDAFVDAIWAEATGARVPVLAARFHRAWADVNRAPDDIDAELLAAPWPQPLRPTVKSGRGQGLVWRDSQPGVPLYAGPLALHDVRQRLDGYYVPYRNELARLFDETQRGQGFVCHINAHSMKSVGNGMNDDAGRRRPDIVLSDRDGASAVPRVVQALASPLRALGLQVWINHPYKGGDILGTFGDPARGRHSVQVEINRNLYMDEATVSSHAGYPQLVQALRRAVDELSAQLADELGRALLPDGASRL
ncbi:MAG TPA: N-formylglutamate amidohydrolase [Ramlibacter sp.]|nr:N-formylglutamate amidohydrolase [Ramlibacter sp.]